MDAGSIARGVAIYALPVMAAIICHEVAHGWVAEKCGDSTARRAGRITLNPISHIDPIGTVILPLILIATGSNFLFGWAKPVPVNFFNLRKIRRDSILVALSGPGTNFALALLSAVVLRLILLVDPMLFEYANSDMASSQLREVGMAASLLVPMVMMLNASIMINCVLMTLNLIPIPPLDGGRILNGLLPDNLSASYEKLEPFGMFIVVLLIYAVPATQSIFYAFIRMFILLFYGIALF
ncbi:MAG: site-2 protease family protein [Nitrospirae bacterium]|nr:site-2 protease family protein [Nitrospirota bacterium]